MSYNSKYTGAQVEAKLDAVDGKYVKPSTGIPKSDLASAVQTSLGKADTALQSYTEQYKGTVEAVDTNESVEDVDVEYATVQYVDNAIARAITTTLNTEV